MSEATDRTWPDALYLLHPDVKTFGEMVCSPERKKYIHEDAHRAEVEAAVKRALEGAEEACGDLWITPDNDREEWFDAGIAAAMDAIRALDPAQFVDGET